MKRAHIFFTCELLFATVLILAAGQATAQSRGVISTQAKDGDRPESTNCHTTVSFSTGQLKFKLCISEHGNLIDLESPAGNEHLTPGTETSWGDGYVLCTAEGVHAYDAGFSHSGWDDDVVPPTIIQPNGPNTLPLTIIRRTQSQRFDLSQTFEWDTERKEVIITMALKNNTDFPISGVQLVREFDGDLSNDANDDIYDADQDSVWGRDRGTGGSHHGLMLTALSLGVSHSTAVESFADWQPNAGHADTGRKCTPIKQNTPTTPGNYTGRLTYNLGPVAAHTTRTVKVLYKRF